MPRPKKVTTENVSEEIADIAVVEEVKPETQIMVAHGIPRQVWPSDLIEAEISDIEVPKITELENEEVAVEESTTELDQSNLSKTSFEIYDNGEYVETVEENSEKLRNYLQANSDQLNDWVQELWSTPSDPNDVIFFNHGHQRQTYRSYESYFNQNGYAPKEPIIKTWMDYYLNIHSPITPEEIAVRLKGDLRFSFKPVK
jgi:hypothetical protein